MLHYYIPHESSCVASRRAMTHASKIIDKFDEKTHVVRITPIWEGSMGEIDRKFVDLLTDPINAIGPNAYENLLSCSEASRVQ